MRMRMRMSTPRDRLCDVARAADAHQERDAASGLAAEAEERAVTAAADQRTAEAAQEAATARAAQAEAAVAVAQAETEAQARLGASRSARSSPCM